MTENAQEIRLLETNPHALVIKYQPTIHIIVRRYVGSGMFKSSEFADIVQSVNVTLLTKIPRLQHQYNGIWPLRTYLSSVIRNICLRLRSEQQAPVALGYADPEGSEGEEIWERLAVGDAYKAFREALSLYGSQQGRLIIHLKLYYKLPPTVDDISSAYPECRWTDAVKTARLLGRGISTKTEQEVFSSAAALLNKLERKSITADGHRRWVSGKIEELTELLNARLPGADLDNHDLGTLLETITFQIEGGKGYIQDET